MRRLLIVLTLILLARPALAALATMPAAPPAPEPEQFLGDGEYSNYEQAVEGYLRDQADSPAAPRVALDLLITASVYDDQVSASKMRKLIVAAYPTSVQAKYLIGSMPDVSQFTRLMEEVAADNFDTMPAGFPTRFVLAVRLGVARFGAAGLGGGAQLVREFVLAQMAHDPQLATVAVQVLNASGPAGEIWRRILVNLADVQTPLLTRIQRLHAMTNRGAAVPFEQFLIAQLPDALRQSPDVMRIQADDLLDAGRLSDALPILQKLAAAGATAPPRILFWQAWGTAAAGDYAAADQLLRRAARDNPQDPWAKQAMDLAPAVTSLDANLVRNVEAALALSRGLKRGTGALEAHATFTRSDGQQIGIYLGIDSPNLFELVLSQGGTDAIQYRATDTQAWLYTAASPVIDRYSKPVLLPVPGLVLTRVGTDFGFEGSLKFAYSFDELQSGLTDLLASDLVSTRDGLEDVLHSFVRRGIFPLVPQPAAGGATTYTWIKPAVNTPELSRFSITIMPDGAITALQAGGFQINDLRYGPAGSLKIDPPPLPNVSSIDKGPMSVAVLQTALPAVYELLYPPPSTQPAVPSAAKP